MKIVLALTLLTLPIAAQRHELGLLLGPVIGQTRGPLKLSSGTAFQANYAYRIANPGIVAVYAEVHFLADPQRTIASAVTTATRDVATLYVTPGLRLKFLPAARLSPYLTAGAGYGLYEHSLTVLNGQPNPAPRTVNRGVLTYGAGLDARVTNWLALRGEVRDFYSGSPVFNVPSLTGRQHNVVVSGGFVIRFR